MKFLERVEPCGGRYIDIQIHKRIKMKTGGSERRWAAYAKSETAPAPVEPTFGFLKELRVGVCPVRVLIPVFAILQDILKAVEKDVDDSDVLFRPRHLDHGFKAPHLDEVVDLLRRARRLRAEHVEFAELAAALRSASDAEAADFEERLEFTAAMVQEIRFESGLKPK